MGIKSYQIRMTTGIAVYPATLPPSIRAPPSPSDRQGAIYGFEIPKGHQIIGCAAGPGEMEVVVGTTVPGTAAEVVGLPDSALCREIWYVCRFVCGAAVKLGAERIIHLHYKGSDRAWLKPVECDFCDVKHCEKFDYDG
ncbi:hypothetical protein B0H17DRAFT_1137797 [Mycena rosella]|uniref:Uncharacterized protein n=1 Tax=Mycena rosella TaxID=1033263 RepID=A0AAD7D7R5_MYCRO|nr:hypothetical protein B0H17DRAFT_1137797 [Mycena rosella]